MDRIAIALRSGADEKVVRELVCEIGFEFPREDFEVDGETAQGNHQYKRCFEIARILYLVKRSTDNTSNRITQEMFEDFLNDRTSRIEQLVRLLSSMNLESDIWMVFAYSWVVDQDIVLYEGNASAFSTYLRLNGGAFRTTCNIMMNKNVSNIDLDTPVLWKVITSP